MFFRISFFSVTLIELQVKYNSLFGENTDTEAKNNGNSQAIEALEMAAFIFGRGVNPSNGLNYKLVLAGKIITRGHPRSTVNVKQLKING